jgi:hypothetical protein
MNSSFLASRAIRFGSSAANSPVSGIALLRGAIAVSRFWIVRFTRIEKGAVRNSFESIGLHAPLARLPSNTHGTKAWPAGYRRQPAVPERDRRRKSYR